MARKTIPDYAAIMRSSVLAEKILEYSENERGNDDLTILLALVSLIKRLDDLSKKIVSRKAISHMVNIHRKALVEGKALTETEIDKRFLMNWTKARNEARSIYNEAAKAGIELRSVPAGDGTPYSFEQLQSWHDELLCKIHKSLKKQLSQINSSGKAELPKEKTGLWLKIYEKTIKAFFAAILDKANPS